ncbi:MAG: glycoside hydrolase family 2 [Clostridia bacterium]|nr:glycoside hydrolase family 2 [Clostridia bacterium]
MKLRSRYTVGEIPHSEHPCPQRMRKDWACLNGAWDFYKQTALGKREHESTILVPFSPESLLSGLSEDFCLKSGEMLVYSRKFTVAERWLGGVTKLHFGAVDSECSVLVNGESAGAHTGGYTAFSLDITHLLRAGENELVVYCKDEGTRNGDARGKQSDKRGGIWYTPQSGIWQTVWLENMPKRHIENLKITPSVSEKSVKINADCDGAEMEITVFDGEKEILREKFTSEVTLSYDFELWSPENPKLYDFTLTSETGDCIRSYFGVRSFGVCTDGQGKKRLTLNGKPYFFNGVLDQGYFSDGMLTYPSDKAMLDELTMLKEMGFNTVRKHIKIEPMRWYYHCDRLGLVVWQDFVNGGGEYKFSHIALFPFFGFKHRDDDYKYFAREDAGGRYAFKCMVDETLAQLYNCPCIGVWVPFNEGWGQFDSAFYTEYIQAQDGTRIIDSVSGWHDQGEQKTALKSLHIYYTPLKVPKDNRPVVLSEFGGYSMKVQGHTFAEKEFGYKKFKTQEKLVGALRKLYLKKLKPLIKKGLCGCIYTQVSDVEEEINGFVTYDRAVLKVPVEEMKKINAEIALEAEKIQ